MATVTSFSEILHTGRETVKTAFEFVGENEAPLYKEFTKGGKQLLTEQGYRIPIETRRPGGHTSFDRTNVNFRDPVSLETDSMRTYPVWYALPFRLDGASMRALKRGDENQFMDYKRYMKSVTRSAMKRLNYYMHGDGTAALAVITSVVTANGSQTINLQSLASAAAGEAETKGSVRLEVNHVYAIVNASTSAIRSTFTVTAILSKTSVTALVANFATNSASGDPIVDLGATASLTAYKKAPNGLRGLCAASGILQNVSRSDYIELKTPRVNAGDNPITPFLFRTAKDLVRIANNDTEEGTGKMIIMTPGMDGALCNQQFSLRRYEGNEVVRGVAAKYIDAEGDQRLLDADAAEDRIYMIDRGGFKLGEEKPFGIFNEDGNDIRMLAGTNSSGSDSFAGSVGTGLNLIKEGLPKMDVYIDRISQTDVSQQISL